MIKVYFYCMHMWFITWVIYAMTKEVSILLVVYMRSVLSIDEVKPTNLPHKFCLFATQI